MVTADDVTQGKPHPQPYLKGAEILGLNPVDCVVLEDAPSGLKAARAAGCRSFGIPTTYRRDELVDATVILESLQQLSVRKDENPAILLEW
jgi:sugar-phosphatase